MFLRFKKYLVFFIQPTRPALIMISTYMHTASITRSVLLVYLGGEIITENGPIPPTIFLASGFTLLVHPNVIYCDDLFSVFSVRFCCSSLKK